MVTELALVPPVLLVLPVDLVPPVIPRAPVVLARWVGSQLAYPRDTRIAYRTSKRI